jgi:hypothetical protein
VAGPGRRILFAAFGRGSLLQGWSGLPAHVAVTHRATLTGRTDRPASNASVGDRALGGLTHELHQNDRNGPGGGDGACNARPRSELQLGWYVDGDEQEQTLRALLDEYTKLHPETTFDLQITPYDGMSEKFRQYAASGIMPDVSLTSSMEPVVRPVPRRLGRG